MTEELKGLVKEVWKDLLKKQERGRADKIKEAWRRAAGPRAARHTEIVYLTKDRIHVNVESSAWLHALTLKRESLEKKLQAALGPLGLKLRLGPVKKDRRDENRPRT